MRLRIDARSGLRIEEFLRASLGEVGMSLDAAKRGTVEARDHHLSRAQTHLGTARELAGAEIITRSAPLVFDLSVRAPALLVGFDGKGGATMLGRTQRGLAIDWLRDLARRIETGESEVPR